jgi:hypothetical protein
MEPGDVIEIVQNVARVVGVDSSRKRDHRYSLIETEVSEPEQPDCSSGVKHISMFEMVL